VTTSAGLSGPFASRRFEVPGLVIINLSSSGGFAARFDAANALAWSSILGGATPSAIALGPDGAAYLTGGTSSADFPTANSIQPYISSNFFYSGDGGASWTASSPTGGAQPLGLAFGPAIAVDPKTPSRVYALTDRLYVSNDRGQSWTGRGTPGYLSKASSLRAFL
jgi:hypothetical protein